MFERFYINIGCFKGFKLKILEVIKRPLTSGGNVLISEFGKFCVKEKKERMGGNQAAGEDIMLKQRKVNPFKCSGKLRERINGENKRATLIVAPCKGFKERLTNLQSPCQNETSLNAVISSIFISYIKFIFPIEN